ncbi:SDR family oxidoreductase [bacterium]|nr:SDR family oxidoreductase [bacterium]
MTALAGRVAIVTGAASGNGRGIAERFAADGADVVIADLDQAGSEETAARVAARGRAALVQRCDVSRRADVDALVAAAVARFGRIDIAVANAGVVETDTDCLRISADQWQRTIDVNLTGVFLTLQAAANRMIAQGGGGRLIAISSIMAEWGGAATPAYTASKAGVKQLVKAFAMAGGRHGITCNAIAPGMIETGMTERVRAVPALLRGFIDRTPVGRIGQPRDVASVAAFLARDEASFVSGTMIVTDGGITAGPYSAAIGGEAVPPRTD